MSQSMRKRFALKKRAGKGTENSEPKNKNNKEREFASIHTGPSRGKVRSALLLKTTEVNHVKEEKVKHDLITKKLLQ